MNENFTLLYSRILNSKDIKAVQKGQDRAGRDLDYLYWFGLVTSCNSVSRIIKARQPLLGSVMLCDGLKALNEKLSKSRQFLSIKPPPSKLGASLAGV